MATVAVHSKHYASALAKTSIFALTLYAAAEKALQKERKGEEEEVEEKEGEVEEVVEKEWEEDGRMGVNWIWGVGAKKKVRDKGMGGGEEEDQ